MWTGKALVCARNLQKEISRYCRSISKNQSDYRCSEQLASCWILQGTNTKLFSQCYHVKVKSCMPVVTRSRCSRYSISHALCQHSTASKAIGFLYMCCRCVFRRMPTKAEYTDVCHVFEQGASHEVQRPLRTAETYCERPAQPDSGLYRAHAWHCPPRKTASRECPSDPAAAPRLDTQTAPSGSPTVRASRCFASSRSRRRQTHSQRQNAEPARVRCRGRACWLFGWRRK